MIWSHLWPFKWEGSVFIKIIRIIEIARKGASAVEALFAKVTRPSCIHFDRGLTGALCWFQVTARTESNSLKRHHVVAWTPGQIPPDGRMNTGEHGSRSNEHAKNSQAPSSRPDTERQFKVGFISNAHSLSDKHAKGALDNWFWLKPVQSVYMVEEIIRVLDKASMNICCRRTG